MQGKGFIIGFSQGLYVVWAIPLFGIGEGIWPFWAFLPTMRILERK